QSDLYGVGALLFFLTTGSAPVTASTLSEVRQTHRDGRGRVLRDVRPDLPREFVDVVERGLSRDPLTRYASAGEMERALSTCLAPAGAVSDRSPAQGLARLASSRMPAWTAIPLILLTVVAVML